MKVINLKLYPSIFLTASLLSCQQTGFKQAAAANNSYNITAPNNSPFGNMLGVNAFEWNLLQNGGSQVDESKMQVIKSFSGIRHYLDWGRIESQQGKYTFNPTHSGGWNLDAIYERCKSDNIDVLVCLKTCPDWLLQTYPGDQRDAENVPMPYGSSKSSPSSYISQAKAGFQFAARYGSNKNVDASLMLIDASSRWTNDPVNQIKTGLGLIKYIECDNERDKWWKGAKAQQTAEEYAANLSAFYDGHKGTLGKGVGIKNADPNMLVVMAGLASADPAYVAKMIDWCKLNRGYKADGTINLCFDIINFHLYTNDNKTHGGTATQGMAPELSEAPKVAAGFVQLANTYHLPVWVTEAGFDINPGSPQRALTIGKRSQELTQADWLIRTALLYSRTGIQKLFFYELYDDNAASTTQYASSGLVSSDMKRRPAADYIFQTKNLLGKYTYRQTISQQPLVDVYKYGSKLMYTLVVPDQTGKTATYTLNLPSSGNVIIHRLTPGSNVTTDVVKKVTDKKIVLTVGETPMFVELQ